MRRIHTFSFFNSVRDSNRSLRSFHQRDVSAQMEISWALQPWGYTYGEPLLNRPPAAKERSADPPVASVDLSVVRPGDLILTTTRPPLSDPRHGDRKRVDRGYTTLEAALFDVWAHYLEVCARLHVKLAPWLHPLVRPGFEGRRDMVFSEREGARYRELNALDGAGWQRARREARTAAFLLRLEELWPEGPGFLGIFAMDGTTTFVWAYLLRHGLAALLTEPGFVMVELVGGPIPRRNTDMRWCLDWKVERVIEHRL